MARELARRRLARARGSAGDSRGGLLGWIGGSSDRYVRAAFIWPALIVILFVSIFPLIVSLILSLSNLQFVPGGFEIEFVGLEHFRDLLFGNEQTHFLGAFRQLTPVGGIVFGAGIGLLGWGLVRAWRGGTSLLGMIFRFLGALLGAGALLLIVGTVLSSGGRPGTIVVTLVYVVVGVGVQFLLGLGLAYLLTQGLSGQRFFRIVFLLPMMITPVGVAYMFRMLTDTSKGPLEPIWGALGLTDFSWVTDPWGARVAVMVGDIWQWTPFMFIVLLAALESQDFDLMEAGMVDGANRWQAFRYITLPQVLPVCATVILIRLIEAFKIVDLPNVLTNGGPGTATESLTLQAYIHWRALNLGQSAAVAYSLLFIVTIVALSYVSTLRRHVEEV